MKTESNQEVTKMTYKHAAVYSKTVCCKSVGSFSIWGGGGGGGGANQARPTSMHVGGGHARTSTCMHTHVLNIHTPMHAHECMHACTAYANIHFTS